MIASRLTLKKVHSNPPSLGNPNFKVSSYVEFW
jgi:hypothetical protein